MVSPDEERSDVTWGWRMRKDRDGASCTSTPQDARKVDRLPTIYPDYADVTIPAGIAPMDFDFTGGPYDCIDVVVRGSKGGELHANGDDVDFDIDDWHALTEQNKGGDLTFTVCVENGGHWTQYEDFKMTVSPYALDEWGLSYRRIAPRRTAPAPPRHAHHDKEPLRDLSRVLARRPHALFLCLHG